MKKFSRSASIALALGMTLTSLNISSQEVLASEKTYVVKSGDTLWKIASNHDVTVNEVKEWNNMKDNTLYIGQKLILSKPSSNVTHIVKSGETLWGVATTYGVTVDEIKKWNNMKTNTVNVGQKLIIQKKANTNNNTNTTPTKPKPTTPTEKPAPKPTEEVKQITHIVKSGETMWKVSTTYDVSVSDIQKWNNLQTTDLSVGQKLIIKTTAKGTETEKEEIKTEKIGVITADVLNVRKNPNTTAAIVTKVYTGAKFTILEEKNKWYKINTDKGQGWVSGDYVKVSTVTTEKEEEKVELKVETYAVTATSLNMRATSDATGKIVTTLPYNAKINVSEIKGKWAYATYGTYKGWVSTDYIKKTTVVNKHKTVMLDAGHGGPDPGAVSKIDGTYEKGLVLATTLKLKSALESVGYTVKMVRTNDSSCQQLYATLGKSELDCRVELTKKENPDIFISIHANSVDDTSVHGTETFYSTKNGNASESARLANTVHKHYKTAMNNNDRKVKTANHYVTSYTSIPSILLEIGFVSNSSDLSKLKNQTTQQNIANRIVQGVDEFFGY